MPAARLPLLFAAGALILACAAAQANNIAGENVSLVKQNPEAKTVLVSFDLAWDNSWRNGANHDAAWVFVKFRPQGSNEWEHAILSSNSGMHLPGGKSVIKAVPDGGGVFVHSSVNHTGSVNFVKNRVRWDYGLNGYDFEVGALIDVSVHAIEMVYIPEGAFFAGSGGSEHVHFYEYTDGLSSEKPYLIRRRMPLPGA